MNNETERKTMFSVLFSGFVCKRVTDRCEITMVGTCYLSRSIKFLLQLYFHKLMDGRAHDVSRYPLNAKGASVQAIIFIYYYRL